MSKNPINGAGGTTVLHLTTSHRVGDNRIYEKECRSLAEVGGYKVLVAGAGTAPEIDSVTVIPLPELNSSRSGRILTGTARGFAVASSVRYDILHIHDPELLPVGIAMAMRGRRVIWDAHEDYISRFTSAATGRERIGSVRVGRPVLKLLGQMDRRASAVVAATPSIAERYRNPLTVVVGNEARLEEVASCDPGPGSRQLLFVGQPTPYHLFPQIVEAVTELPELTLAIAGTHPANSHVQEAHQRLGQRFRTLGWLDRQQLAQAMSESLVGFATLADSPIGKDNSSNKVFEFAAAGLPAVMSPNPANIAHNKQGHHAYLAQDFSARGIREAIRSAADEPDVWRRKSRDGRMWAEEHGSWQRSEEVLLSLYESLTASL